MGQIRSRAAGKFQDFMEDGTQLPGAGDNGVGADPFGRGMHVLAVAAAQSESLG